MCGKELREPALAYPAISKRFGALSRAAITGHDWPEVASAGIVPHSKS